MDNKNKVGCGHCLYFNPEEYICIMDGCETNEANSCPRGIDKNLDMGTY